MSIVARFLTRFRLNARAQDAAGCGASGKMPQSDKGSNVLAVTILVLRAAPKQRRVDSSLNRSLDGLEGAFRRLASERVGLRCVSFLGELLLSSRHR